MFANAFRQEEISWNHFANTLMRPLIRLLFSTSILIALLGKRITELHA
jgi:hypothetical protein